MLIYGETVPKDKIQIEAVTLHYIKGITRVVCKNEREKLHRVREIMNNERPDIIYLHQVSNSSLVKLATSLLPTVNFVHDFKLICPDGKKTLKTNEKICPFPMGYRCQLSAYCYRCMPRNPVIGMQLINNCIAIASLYKKKSQMVVASHFMKNVLIYNGFSDTKIHIIPYFTYLPNLESSSASTEQPIILALGRITKEKGFDYLLRAFSNLQNKARLTIVGDGPELINLKQLAEDRGISSRITFPGWLSHDQLDQLYRQCSMVVVPSIWPEPFGIVGIEAMAYEKPVVAFDVGGISEWLEDYKTGYLIRRGDMGELTDRINIILENPKMAEEMGQAGRVSVEKKFTADSHCESLLNLLQKTIHDYDI